MRHGLFGIELGRPAGIAPRCIAHDRPTRVGLGGGKDGRGNHLRPLIQRRREQVLGKLGGLGIQTKVERAFDVRDHFVDVVEALDRQLARDGGIELGLAFRLAGIAVVRTGGAQYQRRGRQQRQPGDRDCNSSHGRQSFCERPKRIVTSVCDVCIHYDRDGRFGLHEFSPQKAEKRAAFAATATPGAPDGWRGRTTSGGVSPGLSGELRVGSRARRGSPPPPLIVVFGIWCFVFWCETPNSKPQTVSSARGQAPRLNGRSPSHFPLLLRACLRAFRGSVVNPAGAQCHATAQRKNLRAGSCGAASPGFLMVGCDPAGSRRFFGLASARRLASTRNGAQHAGHRSPQTRFAKRLLFDELVAQVSGYGLQATGIACFAPVARSP